VRPSGWQCCRFDQQQREDLAMGLVSIRIHKPRLLLVMITLLLAFWWGWSWIGRPRGVQEVAYTPAASSCGNDGALRYCIYRNRAGTNGDVLYHLHGRNLDETSWNDNSYYTAMVQSEWQKSSALPPIVISLSYGSTWLLTAKGTAEQSGLLDDLMRWLPSLERQTGQPRRRLLLGESMGGLNVLIAGLSHPGHFAKVAALCPGVYQLSPFAPVGEMEAALQRTGADPSIAFGIWMLSRRYFSNDREWQAASPLALIERARPTSPAIYLSNGLYDAYGNFEGTQILAQRAMKRGVKTEWHPIYGGHCATDAKSLAAFLIS
jgi:S-formylglutathione hydrolase FrmB